MKRLKSITKNFIFTFIGQIISFGINLFLRSVLIKEFSNDLIGFENLAISITTLLTVLEFGTQSVYIYLLFKPIVDNNLERISTLFEELRIRSLRIAMNIFIFGLISYFVLFIFYSSSDNFFIFSLTYFIHLFTCATTYILSFQRTIFYVNEKKYINSLFKYSFFTIFAVVKVITIVLFKNFLFYVFISLVHIVLESVVVNSYIKMKKLINIRKFNFKDRINEQNNKSLIDSMKIHKISGVIIGNIDLIFITLFLGLNTVVKHSNMLLLLTPISVFLSTIFQAILASVGQLSTKNDNRLLIIYKSLLKLTIIISTFFSTGIILFSNMFINIWIGNNYLINKTTIILYSLYFFLNSIRNPTLVFRDANGLFVKENLKAILETLTKLVFGFLFTFLFELNGLLLSGIVSLILVYYFEPLNLYRNLFIKKPIDFYIFFILFCIPFIIVLLTHFIVYDNFISSLIYFGLLIFILIILIFRDNFLKNILISILTKQI